MGLTGNFARNRYVAGTLSLVWSMKQMKHVHNSMTNSMYIQFNFTYKSSLTHFALLNYSFTWFPVSSTRQLRMELQIFHTQKTHPQLLPNLTICSESPRNYLSPCVSMLNMAVRGEPNLFRKYNGQCIVHVWFTVLTGFSILGKFGENSRVFKMHVQNTFGWIRTSESGLKDLIISHHRFKGLGQKDSVFGGNERKRSTARY